MVQYGLGALTFQSNDAVTVDGNGVYWGVASTTGWYDLPSMRLFNSPLPRNSGLFRSTSYKGGRTIVINGWISAPTMALREAARNSLLGLPFSGGELTLTVTDVVGSLTCAVELVDCKAVPSGPFAVDFQLTVQARDPRKYGPASVGTTGPASTSGGIDWSTGGGIDWSTGGGINWGTSTSSGQVGLTNPGTAETWPTFTLAANGGTLVNPIITDSLTGGQLAFTLSMAGTDTLIITTNPIARSVLYNNTDRRGAMTAAQWWSVPPSTSDIVSLGQFSASGSPSLTMALAPAYW